MKGSDGNHCASHKNRVTVCPNHLTSERCRDNMDPLNRKKYFRFRDGILPILTRYPDTSGGASCRNWVISRRYQCGWGLKYGTALSCHKGCVKRGVLCGDESSENLIQENLCCLEEVQSPNAESERTRDSWKALFTVFENVVGLRFL